MNKLEENQPLAQKPPRISEFNAADLYPEYRENADKEPDCGYHDDPYFVEAGDSDRTWGIIHPDGFGPCAAYGDYKEAKEICDMLNIAYALGRASNARV